MFELNPHQDPGAWWQHLLMLLVAAILGYIIGYRSGGNTIEELEARLQRLREELEHCRRGLASRITPSVVPVAAAAVIADDLKLIEGIGPQIERLLNEAGIKTFRQLSETSTDRLESILEGGGRRFQVHRPDTWPRQAQLAADGQWDELKAWQDELDGGVA